MGEYMQPQGHLQMVVNLADYGMNPQAALDAPRWQFIAGNQVLLEPTVPSHIALALAQRGHHIEMSTDGKRFGKGQIILQQGGVFVAASEPRGDGLALAL
jgi:gamma-glutamyltranspeptidase/glutathione hydrolase